MQKNENNFTDDKFVKEAALKHNGIKDSENIKSQPEGSYYDSEYEPKTDYDQYSITRFFKVPFSIDTKTEEENFGKFVFNPKYQKKRLAKIFTYKKIQQWKNQVHMRNIYKYENLPVETNPKIYILNPETAQERLRKLNYYKFRDCFPPSYFKLRIHSKNFTKEIRKEEQFNRNINEILYHGIGMRSCFDLFESVKIRNNVKVRMNKKLLKRRYQSKTDDEVDYGRDYSLPITKKDLNIIELLEESEDDDRYIGYKFDLGRGKILTTETTYFSSDPGFDDKTQEGK
ncbi:hypothetical protein GVAV_000553 [Gurleya vavrai]